MELSQFLARTVSPGGHICIAVNKSPLGGEKRFTHQMFAEGAIAEAAAFVRWATRKNYDAYHAQGAFKTAEPLQKDGVIITAPNGKPIMVGPREADNVGWLRSFWIDLDVQRPGDGKDSRTVYATREDALRWLRSFMDATKLPAPNQIINSGYGFHCYWILEDPMLKHVWLPQAQAFKAAMLAHGYIGDSGLTSDAARLLRPVGSVNMKSGQPAPVHAFDNRTRGEYPNSLILTCLQQYVGVQTAAQVGHAQVAHALAGGSVSPIFANAPAVNMGAAASMGIERDARPRYFQRVVSECKQAATSLAARGNGDPYPLWYKGWLTLFTFLADGDAYVHPISDGDPRYVAVEVDKAWARAQAERQRKAFGAPLCKSIELARPGGCAGCRHHGKINSPIALGVRDGDLPPGYRRENGAIEKCIGQDKDGNWMWEEIIAGDLHSPLLDRLSTGIFQIHLKYERAGDIFPLSMTSLGLNAETSKLSSEITRQNMTIPRGAISKVGDFLMAWINKLRDLRVERVENVQPFGWAMDKSEHLGFAYGGKLYRKNGVIEDTPGGDRQLIAWHTPQGDLARWQAVAQFVCDGKPDFQALLAASFGAPLMTFTGQKGLVVSAWSQSSAVGKSSAMSVGLSVWGSRASKTTLNATNNGMMAKSGGTRNLPIYWDELRTDNNDSGKHVNFIFSMVEGTGKVRLNANSELREVDTWETLVVTGSNQSMMDFVAEHTKGTDAGTLRLFEFQIRRPKMPHDPSASALVAETETHYGRAGEIYARYLATRRDDIRNYMAQKNKQISDELKPDTPERFYLAGIVSMLTGATISNKLGIYQFDLDALKKFLFETFYELRSYRNTHLLVDSSGIDHEQAFAMFMRDTMGERIITNRFGKQGQFVTVQWVPANLKTVTVQVSVQDDAIRINRAAFNAWCRKNAIAGKPLVDAMVANWGAMIGRFTFAGGTPMATGTIFGIEIPMSAPAVMGYRYIDPNAKPAKAVP